MRTKTTQLLIGSMLIISGCISSGPDNNAGFGHIEKIEDIEGIYKNSGEGRTSSHTIYLSRIIWPKEKGLEHKDIETIHVRKIDNHTLVVKAVVNTVVKKESTFVEGKDFEIGNGRIRLNLGGGIAGLKAGEPLVGPYYESAELGLDSRGHGKYRKSFATAGLVYLFLPIAIGGNEDVRFIRLND
ncbi:MAG: hypothetical protein EPN55_07235 [Gammaproteobacteria bacterium]|nr:MAG: hypothetical protein EPN55_07235 [Gammaproteobacteria bacterium]